MYQGLRVVMNRRSLVERGERAEATITGVSKGKCGYGYGYSATFNYTVNGRVINGRCECESRAWVRQGDRYLVAYDPRAPEDAHLLVDSMVSKYPPNWP